MDILSTCLSHCLDLIQDESLCPGRCRKPVSRGDADASLRARETPPCLSILRAHLSANVLIDGEYIRFALAEKTKEEREGGPGSNTQTIRATYLKLYGTPQFSFTKFPRNAVAETRRALFVPRDPPLRVSLMLSVSEGDLPGDE